MSSATAARRWPVTPPGVPPAAASRSRGRQSSRRAAVRALLRANLRYWGSVAPVVRTHLTHWRGSARSIPDPSLREIALTKLAEERFNVEVAATLATLAPHARRAVTVEATVALQTAYDYLDLMTEHPTLAGQDGAARLLYGLVSAMSTEPPTTAAADGRYLQALLHTVQVALAELPSAANVLAVARRSAERCAEAQALNHGSASDAGEQAFKDWAVRQAEHSPLGWRELAAGASASVLCMHALIAAAGDEQMLTGEANAIEQLYLMVGALTMLDSLLDHEADEGACARSWPSRYSDEHEMARALAGTAARARNCALNAPDGDHHLVMLGGVIAYYASAEPAGLRKHDPIARALRAELGATLDAPMLVMKAWRLAKSIRDADRSPRRLIVRIFSVYRRWREPCDVGCR